MMDSMHIGTEWVIELNTSSFKDAEGGNLPLTCLSKTAQSGFCPLFFFA